MLDEEGKCAEECRAIECGEALLHVGESERMVVFRDFLQHHLAYGGGAYA